MLRVSVRKQRDLVTIVGNLPSVTPGEQIEAVGGWKQDPRHGRQFQAEGIAISVPTSATGIERYLASGVVRGVGPHLAKLLVRRFGERLFDVIEKEPAKLLRVSGIGQKRQALIVASWSSQKALRDLMIFLHTHGVGSARAYRIYKQYGVNAIGVVRENPYRLADEVRGIGFEIADAIARSLGIALDSEFRLRAGVRYTLSQASASGGHCGLPREDLVEQAAEKLGVQIAHVTKTIDDLLESGRLVPDSVRGRHCVFLPWLHLAETEIASKVRRLCEGTTPWPTLDAAKAIEWVEHKTGMQLAPSQREAMETVLRSKVAIITGGPGVGKTTIVNSIIRILDVKGIEVRLAAPTGRAAKRLSESTGRTATTIHRLLEVSAENGSFSRNEENPIECELLIVDEASMIDVPLMAALVRAIPARSALLLVGDVDQLPSVGPGQVLADTIRSGVVPVLQLTEVFRQAKESTIIVNAHRINRGELPDLGKASESDIGARDFFFAQASDPEDAARKVLQIVGERIPKRFGLDPFREVQVLTPMHKGGAGVQALNDLLQSALNPRGRDSEHVIERFGVKYCPGDKVMQIENDYEKDVFNGDIGVIRSIDVEESSLVVNFQGRPIEYSSDDLDQLVLAYATTIHKSQGSEYPAVVIPILKQHWIMLQRNLLYTAVTRGKRLVVVVGEKQAVARAVKNADARVRWTSLEEKLRTPASPDACFS